MVRFDSEPYIQIVQKILSEEYNEPYPNFRKVSEKIIKELRKKTTETIKEVNKNES